MNSKCRVCNGQIVIMIRRNTGICCEACEKEEKRVGNVNRDAGPS